MSDTHIPEQLKVSCYFKKTSPAEWSISGYIEYEKKQDPFSSYPTFQQHFKLDLITIKSSDDVSNDARVAAGRVIKGKFKKPSTSSAPIKYNTNITADYIGNVYYRPTTMSSAMNAAEPDSATEPAMNAGEPASASASEPAPAPKPALKRKEIAVESSSFIKALFPIVYELYKKKDIPPNTVQKRRESSGLLCTVYNMCIDYINQFESLSASEKSFMNCLLSGCVNTISTSYQVHLAQSIGVTNFQAILNHKTLPPAHNSQEWVELKLRLKAAYDYGGLEQLRTFVISSRLSIYQNREATSKSLSLKILDIYEHILNTVEYVDWTAGHTEEEYASYWVPILRIMFRGTSVSLKTGESTSAASKFERQVNENEYGGVSQNIMGRRIDLLLKGHLSDDKDKQQIIEMAAMEIKPAGVCLETEVIQLNKNVRVNKSILGCLRSHCGEYADDSLFTIGMDVIGLSGYLYVIKQFEDVVVATKAHNKNMFLPADIDEIMDFMDSNTLDQLLNYMDEITSLYQKVKLSSKRFKRQRTSSRTSNSVAPYVSPPPPYHEFPGATFFTPKRPTNKKSQE
ncbi:hypothetical protein PS15m_009693 [Mucor circinelloides]